MDNHLSLIKLLILWVQLIISYNTKNKTCYCEEHIKMYDCSDDNMHKVVRIVSDFKVKLEKMEKYLIYIQERYNYFTDPNSDDKLLPENIIELENIKESLDRKIKRNIIFKI